MKALTAIVDNLSVRLRARVVQQSETLGRPLTLEETGALIGHETAEAITQAWRLGLRDGFEVAACAVRNSSAPETVADALEAARLSMVGP